jgi:hypothetical protein
MTKSPPRATRLTIVDWMKTRVAAAVTVAGLTAAVASNARRDEILTTGAWAQAAVVRAVSAG